VDLDKYKQLYESLKTRAKSVAIELRDKRDEVKVLGEDNKHLRTRVETSEQDQSRLEAQLSVQSKIMEERNVEIASLHSRMENIQEEHSKNLQAYKKKAQESISNTNARVAALSQSKELAESALVEAQLQVQRAHQAMLHYQGERDAAVAQSQQATSEASVQVLELKEENSRLMSQVAKLELDGTKYAQKCQELEEVHKRVLQELDHVQSEYKEHQSKFNVVSKELVEEKARNKEYIICE